MSAADIKLAVDIKLIGNAQLLFKFFDHLIKHYFDNKPPVNISEPCSAGENSPEMIRKLWMLIETSDAEALDFVSSNKESLQCALGLDIFERVAETIQNYDFESALRALQGGTDE